MPILFKAYFYCVRNDKEYSRTLLVPALNTDHAERIVKAYDPTAFQIRLETMPAL